MKVFAFDFDGTLTTRDTLIAFIRYVHGIRKTCFGFFLFMPILILMRLRLYPNWKAKQRLFSWFFRGMTLEEFDHYCAAFSLDSRHLIRSKGMQTIREALVEGAKVIIVSASIDNWVRPFFSDMGEIQVEGTRIDVRDGVLTGQFLTKNCYGREKVKRIRKAFPYRKAYQLIAFGDSRGDREMLDYADERYYRPFRESDNSRIGEIVRFGIVGTTATAIQYGIYLLLIHWVYPTVANTIGYLVSFVFNYIASTQYTFKVKSTTKRGFGFVFSHVINYLLQTVLLSLTLWLGFEKRWAMVPVLCICVPINFILVRFFLKKK